MKEGPGGGLTQDSTETRKGMRGAHTPHLPAQVTQVPRELVRTFAHHKKVGTYLLGRSLGEGSFAKVKEALHLTTGEKVAVKVIDKKRAKADRYVRKNLRREGRLLQQVRHCHVVQLMEVMETEHCYYLVTEFCAGGDLMDYIAKRKRLDEREAKTFIRQIVSAVDYLHRLGIIHRDLKIENLLLDENRNIKIIDFGLSNTIKVSTSPEGTAHAQEYLVTQCGSPAYAAPELLNHQKYGLQVDIWSIGVNMYAMLAGSLPFTVDPFNIKTLYNKMVSGHINPLPPGLSVEARDLLRKLLKADPEQRLTISEALRHPWLAEGRKKPMERHPFPNKLKTSDLDTSILKHMRDNLGFRMSEIIRYVVGNVPSSACATYHLFHRKLQRHQAEQSMRGVVSGERKSEEESATMSLILQETMTSSPTVPEAPSPTGQMRTCDDAVQVEAVTLDDSPLSDGRRKSLETAKTAITTRPTTMGKIVVPDKENALLSSIDYGLQELHISTKENQDNNNKRQGMNQPSSKPVLSSRLKADNPVGSPRHLHPAVRAILKSSHQHHQHHPPVTKTYRRNRTNSKNTPRTAGTKSSTVTPAGLQSSALPDYSRRGRSLVPLTRTSTFLRKGLQREEVSKEASHGRNIQLVKQADKGMNGTWNGNLALRATCPATTSSSVNNSPSSKSPSAGNAFSTQPLLTKRFQTERWQSAQTKTNTGIQLSDEVVRLTTLGCRDDSFNKRAVSSQNLPIIHRSLNSRLRNDELEHTLEKQVPEQPRKFSGDCLEEKVSSDTRKTSSDGDVTVQSPVNQSVPSSPSRALHILPMIPNGVTPHH